MIMEKEGVTAKNIESHRYVFKTVFNYVNRKYSAGIQ